MTCKVMLRQDEKVALLRSPALISHKSALGAHVGRGCQQTKAINRKIHGLKRNFWAAMAPISNWPALPESGMPPATWFPYWPVLRSRGPDQSRKIAPCRPRSAAAEVCYQ